MHDGSHTWRNVNWYVGSRCYVLVLYWFLAYLSDRRLWQLAVVQALLSAADWLPDELSLGRPLLKSSRLPAFDTLDHCASRDA